MKKNSEKRKRKPQKKVKVKLPPSIFKNLKPPLWSRDAVSQECDRLALCLGYFPYTAARC